MHHLDRAAGEPESHRPHRARPRPVDDRIDAGHSVTALEYFLQWHSAILRSWRAAFSDGAAGVALLAGVVASQRALVTLLGCAQAGVALVLRQLQAVRFRSVVFRERLRRSVGGELRRVTRG